MSNPDRHTRSHMCAYAPVHHLFICLCGGHGVHVETRGQLAVVRSPTTCAAGIALRWSGLAAGAFDPGAISWPSRTILTGENRSHMGDFSQ